MLQMPQKRTLCEQMPRYREKIYSSNPSSLDFPRSGDQCDKFLGPVSRRSRQNLPIEMRREDMTPVFPYEKFRMGNAVSSRNFHERKLILTVIILFHNFRTQVFGLNQITTVFNEEYDPYVNVRNNDRITQYYEEVVDSDYEKVIH